MILTVSSFHLLNLSNRTMSIRRSLDRYTYTYTIIHICLNIHEQKNTQEREKECVCERERKRERVCVIERKREREINKREKNVRRVRTKEIHLNTSTYKYTRILANIHSQIHKLIFAHYSHANKRDAYMHPKSTPQRLTQSLK